MTTKVEITEYQCKRCDHKWFPRSARKPRWCPKCNSPYWDRAPRAIGDSKLAKMPLNERPDRDFWIHKTIEQLIEEQGVKPIKDLSELAGYWPEGADFDTFFEGVMSGRK